MSLDIVRELFVEVTNCCLQGCVHCSSCAGPQISEHISLENLKQLIDDGLHLGLECFTVSGGEPLLYPDLEELLRYIKSKDITLNLYTCGIIRLVDGSLGSIDAKTIEVLLNSRPDKIIFSLQGGTSDIHEKVTGVAGSFAMAIASIRTVIEKGFNVELHFVPMSVNVHDIGNVIAIANDFGISKVSILRLVPQGRVIDDLMLSPSQVAGLKADVERLRQEHANVAIRLGAPFSCISLAGNSCSAAKNKLLISATGEFYPCEAFKSLRGTRPTLYNSKILDVWKSDLLLNQIRRLDQDGVINCSFCHFYGLCNGGCPGQRMLANGNIAIGPDPWCKLLHD